MGHVVFGVGCVCDTPTGNQRDPPSTSFLHAERPHPGRVRTERRKTICRKQYAPAWIPTSSNAFWTSSPRRCQSRKGCASCSFWTTPRGKSPPGLTGITSSPSACPATRQTATPSNDCDCGSKPIGSGTTSPALRKNSWTASAPLSKASSPNQIKPLPSAPSGNDHSKSLWSKFPSSNSITPTKPAPTPTPARPGIAESLKLFSKSAR